MAIQPARFRSTGTLVLGQVASVELGVNWRWLAICCLTTFLLADRLLPLGSTTRWSVPTDWTAAILAVLSLEGSLLAHELGHALVARGRGREVRQIVFHGFRAQTVVDEGQPGAADEVRIALAGPAVNLALVLVSAMGLALMPAGSAAHLVVLLILLGNGLMLLTSLLPVADSDGQRALQAFRRR